jgi:Tfp pilus assembly protein PilF
MSSVQEVRALNRRLDSWKEIAAFFDRDERTVKRWEKERLLPVHRLPGGSRARVFAFTGELERWMHSLESSPAELESSDSLEPVVELAAVPVDFPSRDSAVAEPVPPPSRSRWRWLAVAVSALVIVAAIAVFLIAHRRHAAAATKSAAAASAVQTARASRASAGNAEAQELYLRGRYYWDKRTPQDLNKAVDFFTQAIVHDPNYAQAYVGLADCYHLLREFSAMPSGEAYPRALAAARKAVELDDSSAEAHASLAFSTLYWGWDEAGADREFRRAIQLNPDYAPAHHWYANALSIVGKVPEALVEINRAEHLDPASNAVAADKALILATLGKPDEAEALLKQLEASQPGFFSTHQYLSYVYFAKGDYRNYAAEAVKAATLSHNEAQLAAARAAEQGFHAGGKQEMLVNERRAQEKLFNQGQMPPYLVALTCARLGESEDALHYLETAIQQHDPAVLAMRNESAFSPLHRDPRFRNLLAKAGMAPLS